MDRPQLKIAKDQTMQHSATPDPRGLNAVLAQDAQVPVERWGPHRGGDGSGHRWGVGSWGPKCGPALRPERRDGGATTTSFWQKAGLRWFEMFGLALSALWDADRRRKRQGNEKLSGSGTPTTRGHRRRGPGDRVPHRCGGGPGRGGVALRGAGVGPLRRRWGAVAGQPRPEHGGGVVGGGGGGGGGGEGQGLPPPELGLGQSPFGRPNSWFDTLQRDAHTLHIHSVHIHALHTRICCICGVHHAK